MSGELTILDGGMGAELIRRGWPSEDLWSAKALLEKPEVVRAVHQDYVSAGARVIITNTYSTVPSYLAKENMQSRYVELTGIAARLAREVADAAPAKVRVAGCLPPLSESYRPDLVPKMMNQDRSMRRLSKRYLQRWTYIFVKPCRLFARR